LISQDLLELVRHRPFTPLRVYATDGRTYDIHHPDQMLVLRNRVVLGIGGDNGAAERLEHLSLLHVVRVEELAREGAA
jgi:hypothetical protein